MLVIAVIAAELIVGGKLPSLPIFALSLITPVAVSSAAFAINDYLDIEVDRENGKRRPLATGEAAPRDALIITAAGLVVGLSASLLINAYAFAIAVVFGLLSLLYSYRLKGMALLGNAYVGFSMAIPFIFGSYVVSEKINTGIILISLMIFLSGTAREVHGAIRDLRGDTKARKLRTLPIVIGVFWSSVFALLLYIVAIAISAFLFASVSPFRGNLFFGAPVLLSDLMLAYVGMGYLARPGRSFRNSSRNISLLAMGIALVAILLAPL